MSQGVHPDWMPIDPIREAYEDSGINLYELAKRLGITKKRPGRNRRTPDTSSVGRMVGVRDNRQYISINNALRIADALNLDPVDVGV